MIAWPDRLSPRRNAFRGRTTLLKARSNGSGLSSTSTSRAVSMKRLNCSGLSGFGLGLRGIALSGRTRECFDNGRSEGVRYRSRQPLRMLLGPPLEYEQILPDSDIARTRLDRHWRKPVKSAHLERAVEISRQIGSTGQTIRCCVFTVADSGTLPIEIVACNAGCARRNGSQHRREHRDG